MISTRRMSSTSNWQNVDDTGAAGYTAIFKQLADDLQLAADPNYKFVDDEAVGAFPGVVEDLVELISRPATNNNNNPLTLRQLESVVDALCGLAGCPAGAQRCVVAGALPAVLNLLLFFDSGAEHIPQQQHTGLLRLLLLLLLSDSAAVAASAVDPYRVIAALSKRLLRISDAATSLCLSILLALVSGGGSTAAARHNVFRAALVSHVQSALSGKLVLVLQVSPDAAAKRKAAKLLRIIASPTSN